jgi:glycosyltransferase involved in cell wall biosynthesis
LSKVETRRSKIDPKMKLLILATADSIHSHRWVDFFARQGHEVHWVSFTQFNGPKSTSAYTYEIAPHRHSNFHNTDMIHEVRKLRSLLKKIQPDLLHAHYAGRYGLVGTLSGFRPFIITAWGSDVLIAGKSFLTKPLVKLALRRADLVTCDAEHMRQAIIRLGVPEPKIWIIYFGTDISRFSPSSKNENLRNQLRLSDRPVIISLRSLEPIYDLETLLQAVPYVIKKFPLATFLIAGEGSQKNYLKGIANDLGIVSNVRFTGSIPNNQLPDYLRAADIYVSTSLSDAGLSASTAEAMACALPVVVTDWGENKLWVKEGEGGFLVPLKDPAALSEKILYLLENPHLSQRYGSFNRGIIQERNNYEIEMGKMATLYQEVVQSYGKP